MTINTNKLSLMLIITLFGFFGQHQLQAQGNHCFGLKGGLNASNLYANELNDENVRLGFHVGGFAQVLCSKNFALQTELLYSTKGSLVRYDAIDQDVKYNLSYLDMPLLLVFKIGKVAEIHAGGYASYLLDARISYSGDVVNGVDKIDRDNLKSYDYGLAAGAGLNIGAMQVGVRYNYGLVALAKTDAAKTFLGDAKNSNAQIFLAFNFGKR